MDIRIGIQHTPRELTVKTDQGADEVQDLLATAIAEGSLATLTDTKGGRGLVDGSKISYVELGSEESPRVGFLG
jgi:hypothetical protein